MLNKIIEQKKKEIEKLKARETIQSLVKKIDGTTTRDFLGALSDPAKINIIAELKKASPSRGVIIENFDPALLAIEYTNLGAAALSVLTDIEFFQGRPENIAIAKNVSPLPILRKDFIIDALQIYESRALGADAILLIAAVLTKAQIQDFINKTIELDMIALVEVHDEKELDIVLQTNAQIIGINNRNLKDFSVNLNTTKKLIKKIPQDKIIVSESGILTKEDIPEGVNAILIGEGLVKNISLLQ